MRALVSVSIMARFASSRATDARRVAQSASSDPIAQKRPIVQMETNATSSRGCEAKLIEGCAQLRSDVGCRDLAFGEIDGYFKPERQITRRSQDVPHAL
jgi:hypothetical protein